MNVSINTENHKQRECLLKENPDTRVRVSKLCINLHDIIITCFPNNFPRHVIHNFFSTYGDASPLVHFSLESDTWKSNEN